MPGQQQEESAYLDEHHQRIVEFAQDYMDDDERDEFVDGLMERRGYQRIQGWGPPEPEDPDPQDGRGAAGRRSAAATPPRQRRSPHFKR